MDFTIIVLFNVVFWLLGFWAGRKTKNKPSAEPYEEEYEHYPHTLIMEDTKDIQNPTNKYIVKDGYVWFIVIDYWTTNSKNERVYIGKAYRDPEKYDGRNGIRMDFSWSRNHVTKFYDTYQEALDILNKEK